MTGTSASHASIVRGYLLESAICKEFASSASFTKGQSSGLDWLFVVVYDNSISYFVLKFLLLSIAKKVASLQFVGRLRACVFSAWRPI